MAEKEIVPELIQNEFSVSNITNHTVRLLQDIDYRGTMIGELKKIGKKLGEPGAYKRAALCIEDFINNDGWTNSKSNGKMRLEGKDYIVKDGDVLNFRFNT